MVETRVFTGEGKAGDFLQLKPYRKFIEEKLGFDPYPGTLNVRTDPQKAQKLKQEASKHVLASHNYNGREIGGINIYKVRIEGKNAGIVEPELTRYSEDVLEVVASEKLREALEISDGDLVEVTTAQE